MTLNDATIDRYVRTQTASNPWHVALEYEWLFVTKAGPHNLFRASGPVIEGMNLGQHGIITELVQHCGEFPMPHRPLSGNVLAHMERELMAKVRAANTAAAAHGATVLCTGISPTTQISDLGVDALVPNVRYLALNAGWLAAREAYKVKHGSYPSWNGYEPDSIAVTGAAAATQPHTQLHGDPIEAGRQWNNLLLITPWVLAISCNSPLFLGKKTGCHEFRAKLWTDLDDLGRGRVCFGPGYVKSAAEVLAYYLSIDPLNLDAEEPPTDQIALLRHTKSVWPFLRLIPDRAWHAENRALPCEAETDTVATCAFYWGLAYALDADKALADRLRTLNPFPQVHQAFNNAVQHGPGAMVHGLDGKFALATKVVLELIPIARQGLLAAGIHPTDAEFYLQQVQTRAKLGRTGSVWQLKAIDTLGPVGMTEAMIRNQRQHLPIASWPEWETW